MFDQDLGPRTTFEEDVKLLGIANLFEDGSAVAAAAVKPGTTQPGAQAPAAQTQAQKPAKPAKTQAQEAEDEDEDEDEEIVGEEDEGEEDEGEDSEDSEDEDEGEDEGEEDESAEEDVDPDFEAAVEEDEKLGAAIDVLGAFYDRLDEDEGESLDSDTLVAVIEAFEYVTEQFGLLDEMRRFRIKGGKKRRITRGQKKKAKQGNHQVGRVDRMKYTASGKKVRKSGDEIRAQKRAARKLAMGAASRKGGAMHRARSMRKSKRLASDESFEGTPLSELVQNLGALKEAVQGKVDYRKSAEELKEGFNSIGETASTWMESIATEVKQAKTEDQDFDAENDPRVQMGRHLDGIAESAALIIQALDAGEADLQEAATDLESLAADLNDAAEVMKSIE